LWKDPFETNERLTDFLRLTPEQTVRDFIQHNVRRSSENLDGAEVTQLERLIGGPLLEQSLKPLQLELTHWATDDRFRDVRSELAAC
jgi:hypothetical protein